MGGPHGLFCGIKCAGYASSETGSKKEDANRVTRRRIAALSLTALVTVCLCGAAFSRQSMKPEEDCSIIHKEHGLASTTPSTSFHVLPNAADKVSDTAKRISLKIRDFLKIAKLPIREQKETSSHLHESTSPPDDLIPKALEAIYSDDRGWKKETEEDGVTIYSRIVKGSKLKQIRGHARIKADAENVLKLFQSSSVDKIREFNPMYSDGEDIEKINGYTKISWSKTYGVPFFSPRDFVTFVQLLRTAKGDILILNKSTDHPKCPSGLKGCVRANMILGANRVTPLKQSGECEFTFVQHVDVGGSLPVWLMNKIMLSDSVNFIKRIEKAAQTSFNDDSDDRRSRSIPIARFLRQSQDEMSLRPKLI
mmetsp:Transcript_33042/g.56072  ORF Transcript_33042/g.56072 Transcript_33042/m.56072 type:complete len:366 (+) Transcript_33042:142-1239(+)